MNRHRASVFFSEGANLAKELRDVVQLIARAVNCFDELEGE